MNLKICVQISKVYLDAKASDLDLIDIGHNLMFIFPSVNRFFFK